MRGVGFEPTTALSQQVSYHLSKLELEPAALGQARRPPHILISKDKKLIMFFDFKELRISINKCNLNCLYCKKEGIPEAGYEMLKEEILELIYRAKKFKVKKVKFTVGNH